MWIFRKVGYSIRHSRHFGDENLDKIKDLVLVEVRYIFLDVCDFLNISGLRYHIFYPWK